jgi:hypothetical protein
MRISDAIMSFRRQNLNKASNEMYIKRGTTKTKQIVGGKTLVRPGSSYIQQKQLVALYRVSQMWPCIKEM